MAIWLSVCINYLIDLLGHVSRDGAPVRSWASHSVFTAPCFAGLITTLTLLAASKWLQLDMGSTAFAFWIVLGAIIGMGHLLLDSLTGAGVYLGRRRVALAHLAYDNLPLNLGFIFAGVCLAVCSFRC